MNVSAPDFILSFAAALIAHEMGHFVAARLCQVSVSEAGLGWGPKLFGFRVRGVDLRFRLLPVGAYVKLNMVELQTRPLTQQLFVLLAGIIVNLTIGLLTWGTFFSTVNLALTFVNLFPLYQHDGWKAGILIFRRTFNRPIPLVEWSFTISAGLIVLALGALTFSIL